MNIILLSALWMNTADAKKNKGGDAATNNPSSTSSSTADAATNAPSDSKSKAFIKALLNTGLTNFSPDAEGLKYKTMTFNADNTFRVDAALTAMDEEIECAESGKWTMDAAESKTTASMNWSITSSDCPTRSTPIELRVKVLIEKNEIHFR